jgi:hypothetical protein
MYGMRRRKIQNCSWNGDMHVLRGRIVFSRSWCYDVCQLSVELRCFVRWMFDAQQLRVQRGLYGVKRQLYSVSCREIQSYNRQCNVLNVSRVFRCVMQWMHRSESV